MNATIVVLTLLAQAVSLWWSNVVVTGCGCYVLK